MKLEINKEKILELLDYYHDFLLPVGVIVVCFLLTLFILLPQFFSILTTRDSYDIEKNKLDNINENLSYVTALGTTDLETKLNLATSALPASADFDPIISAIYSAAASSGTAIGSFQFGLENPVAENGLATISLVVRINSGVSEANEFIKEIYKTLPISSVNAINIGENGKQLTLIFYYKPQLSSLPDYTSPIPKITSKDDQILSDIVSWKKPQNFLTPGNTSTSSGSFGPNFPF